MTINYSWHTTNKNNYFIIGTEPALEATNKEVIWYCEWNPERSMYKQIPTVLEVEASRRAGGSVAVSPQEFALIPKTVDLKMQSPK